MSKQFNKLSTIRWSLSLLGIRPSCDINLILGISCKRNFRKYNKIGLNAVSVAPSTKIAIFMDDHQLNSLPKVDLNYILLTSVLNQKNPIGYITSNDIR